MRSPFRLRRSAAAAALASAAVLALAAGARAAPSVAADIAPVHSLVARVMQGVGAPMQVLPPGASPHGHALRPSEAATLEAADLVVWIGPELTPWLEDAVDSLAPDAARLTLLEVPGITLREFREDEDFTTAAADAHGHDDHDHAHDDHAHDDDAHDAAAEAAAQDHDDDHAHDDHAHSHDDHDHDHDEAVEAAAHDHGDDHAHDDHAHDDHAHDHAHDGADPHAWLDPGNAAVWLDAIAEALAEADPANAALYRTNAAEGRAELAALSGEVAETVAPLAGKPYAVFHDAYQYFEARFGLQAAGTIALSDAASPGPRRLAEVRDRLSDIGAVCVFSEPQFPTGLAETVVEGTPARLGEIDPLGAELEAGPGLYPALIRDVADDLAACLTPTG